MDQEMDRVQDNLWHMIRSEVSNMLFLQPWFSPCILNCIYLKACFAFFSISIAYASGKVSRVVAHPTPLDDEERGDLDCRNHTRRMYRVPLLLSYMVNVLCSGDVNGKKADQVPSMIVLSGPSIVVLQCLGGRGRRCKPAL